MRVLILLPVLASATACSTDVGGESVSGVSGSRTFAASGFDSVALEGPDRVIVRTGAAASVVATGDTEVLDRLRIDVVDGGLRIGREKSKLGMNWGGRKHAATVTVTLPEIKTASLAGSGDMDIDAVRTPAFEASVAGSGGLRVATIAADSVTLSVAGSGGATLAGTTRSAEYSIAGSGDVDAAALAATTADVSVAGSGRVTASATGTATVSILGSGDVDIVGGAQCRISRVGSGRANCTKTAQAAP